MACNLAAEAWECLGDDHVEYAAARICLYDQDAPKAELETTWSLACVPIYIYAYTYR